MKHLIRFYARFISPLFGPSCRFYPTCSAYAQQAIGRYGVFKGSVLAIWRIIRCNPWFGRCGHDPVPEDVKWSIDWRSLIRYNRVKPGKPRH